jgi:transposase
MSVYVGIDVHRKRSQVAVVDQTGEVLANRNVTNGVGPILAVIGDLPVGTPAAFEAAFGWGWLVELLEDYGFDPHLVHPSRCTAIASARLKNDKVDAHILAQLLRADLLPEAWIAPPAVRQLRTVLRHRIGLVRLRTLLRNRIHAVLADHGQHRAEGCWSGPGRDWLAGLQLPTGSREVIADCLAIIDVLQAPIDRLDGEVRAHAKADPRVQVLTRLPGVGPLTALVILAEIGDIGRFGSARKLAAWAGLTLVGNDGGLLTAPAVVSAVDISPGERVDLLVDFTSLGASQTVTLRCALAGWDVLEFRGSGTAGLAFSSPAGLSTIAPLGAPAFTRSFSFDGMTRINGKVFDPARVDFQVPADRVETWTFKTSGNAPHPVHIHGASFQVVSRAGGRARLFPWEGGWKDTVLLNDGETVAVKIRFEPWQRGQRYLIHCHKLEHEDAGMMAAFTVV